MVNYHKRAGLGSDGGSVLLFMAANPGVIALTGQADVTIIVGGSSAASWLNSLHKLKEQMF